MSEEIIHFLNSQNLPTNKLIPLLKKKIVEIDSILEKASALNKDKFFLQEVLKYISFTPKHYFNLDYQKINPKIAKQIISKLTNTDNYVTRQLIELDILTHNLKKSKNYDDFSNYLKVNHL